jgi:hypothetical protein
VHTNPDAIYDTRVYRTLRRLIELCLRWRKTVVAVTVSMFVGALAAFGLVQQQFFPTSTARAVLRCGCRKHRHRRNRRGRRRRSACSPTIGVSCS